MTSVPNALRRSALETVRVVARTLYPLAKNEEQARELNSQHPIEEPFLTLLFVAVI